MKIIQLSALLVLFVATFSAHATRQARDPLVWKGETVYPENGPTIWGAFPENKEIIQKPKFDFESTASIGYTAEWEIKDDALYLMSLEGKIDGKKVGVSDVFADKTAPILASWFSGTIIIPRGKEIGLLKEGEARYVYTKETHLIIEKGKVAKVEEKTFDPENTPVCKFEGLAKSHIAANVPDTNNFSPFLIRDLTAYLKPTFGEKVTVGYELLRDGATQTGVAYPKFYVWLRATNAEKAVFEGAATVAAIEKKRFDVRDFVTRSNIVSSPDTLPRMFPRAVVEKILTKAGVTK